MKKLGIVLCAGVAVWLTGCAELHPLNTITQSSTIDALLAGAYDGTLSCGELETHGDTGIGTFDRLDGEMILLDGVMYQVRADGSVCRPGRELRTPFAAVCWFAPDATYTFDRRVSDAELKGILDEHMPNQNLFYAIRITGRFARVHTRSVPAQAKPYPPLAKVTATQPEFNATNVVGTVVGFRCPPFVKGINVPGYHLHFLSAAGDFGGHLLDFDLVAGQAQIDICDKFNLMLPAGADALASLDLSKDRSEELKQVEE